ncbi:hypothetical protein [Brevibacterium sp.]|uniref:hypothetical protein n=1 Tax=Brevibacterium sp. TaxID=1701 RepID=UPI00281208F0|nr:hypothetical protein [Brevibacterium sp.]
MAPIDPIADQLKKDLRIFRRGEGEPSIERMTGLDTLTDALGEGIPSRAFDTMERYYDQHGHDPETDVGAFFYMSGWGVGLSSVNRRRDRYAEQFVCDISTAWRRSERGIKTLVMMIRDHHENSRPWAFVSIFQSGAAFQPFLDFNLGYESWRAPVITLDGKTEEVDFHLHQNPDDGTRFTRRIILPESPLKTEVGFAEPMATLRVVWEMPVWPVWQLGSWTADPRIFTRLRTFRQRAIEVSLEWWRKELPTEIEALEGDDAIWVGGRTRPR